MKKCGCKRNLLGVCSCKRVSRGRKTRRAITDEPYERSIKPRYAVPRSRRPESNFPIMDPKRPGQILKPGVPSTSKGFTAPSPFSRGATSAFGPVLQAASNYLNEITTTARIQNRMAMSNMGGGGSAGSRSNIAVNGSVESRNTGNTLSTNLNLAPINENVNVINSDGTYQSFRSPQQAFAFLTGQDRFEADANLARQNLSANLPQAPPINIQNQMDIDDDDESVQVLNDEDREILANNQQQNENLNKLINQELKDEPLYDNDIWLFNALDRASEETQERFLRKLNEKGDFDIFEKNFNRWRDLGSPEPNMAQVDTSFKQNVANYLWEPPAVQPPAVQPPVVQPPVTPIRPPSSASSNFGPNDSVTSSSKGSTMYAPVSNAQNVSSSSIGSKSGKQELKKFQSPLGDQDRKKLEETKKKSIPQIPQMDVILPENVDDKLSESTETDVRTEEQMEPSEFTDGSVALSDVSSKGTRQSALVSRARAQEVANANRRNKVFVTGGGGQRETEKLKENVFENDPEMKALEEAGPAAILAYARNLGGFGHKKKEEQEEMFKETNTPTQETNTVNVLVPKSVKKNKGGLGFGKK
jgi:hypothetical protein